MRRLGWLGLLPLVVGLYSFYLRAHPAGDLYLYYQMVDLAQRGLHPFIDYWSEYPPLFPLLLVGLQHAIGPLAWADEASFTHAYYAVMSLVYAANLFLVWDLARIGHGTRTSHWAVVMFACCPPIAWFTLGWFDGLALLLLLLGMRALLARGARRAGVLIALGILTKIFPGVLLLVAPATLGRRGTLRLVVAMSVVLVVVLLPLAILRSDLLGATAVSMLTRPPWETLPALLAGDYVYGVLAPLTDRLTVDSARSTPGPYSGMTLILQLLTALTALAAAWYRTRRGNLRATDLYALVAFGLCALLLGNKGFSPQYLVWLLPLLPLVWPNRIGILYMLVFSIYAYIYFQFWLGDVIGYYQLDTVTVDQVARTAWLSVLTRTTLLVVLGSHLLVTVLRPASYASVPTFNFRLLVPIQTLTRRLRSA
jgi:hypothetical protein